MSAPPGISLDVTDSLFTDPATWTRLDTINGLLISSITITRGRPDERSKTSPAQVSIKGFDELGILDPTNSGSPLAGGLDPVKQAAISLWNPNTNVWSYIFRGYVSDYTLEFSSDLSKPFIDFEITLTDILDLLNDAEVIPDTAGNIVPTENIGDSFYTGQHCDDRIFAVLADTTTAMYGAVWPTSQLQIASGNVFVQGKAYPNQSALLQVIDDACDAEGPYATNRFITKDGAFAFRGRYYRYVPSAFLAANDAARTANHRMVNWSVADVQAWTAGRGMAGINGLKWTRGKTNLINSCDITPAGIRTDQIAGQEIHDATSISKYGVRTSGNSLESLIIIKGDDGNDYITEAKTYANTMVHNYKNPVTRVSQLKIINPVNDTDEKGQNTWAMLCGVELSDLVTVYTHHTGGGGFNGVDHYVEQITYNIVPLAGQVWQVEMTLDLTPRSYYSFMDPSWKPPAVGGIQAGFTYSQVGGLGSTNVQFTDTSTPGPSGPITAWAWDFGDGGTSTLQNPSHTYASTGLWEASLTVTGTGADGTSRADNPVILA